MSKFGLFVIGNKFSKEFSNHIADKRIIKWEILPDKNQNNQREIIFEYENRESESTHIDNTKP